MLLFDQTMLDELVQQAKASPRLRANYNVHTDLTDPVQRLFIAIEPGSYVAPHLHPEPEKWEFFMAVRGRMAAYIFDAEGVVLQRHELVPGVGIQGFEIPYNTWHCIAALESGSVFFEVKRGPYRAMGDKGFAPWAPREGEVSCQAFYRWLINAQVGDRPPVV